VDFRERRETKGKERKEGLLPLPELGGKKKGLVVYSFEGKKRGAQGEGKKEIRLSNLRHAL